jgi:hypothetical protein
MEVRKQRKWRRFAQGESFGSNPPPGHSYPLPRQTPTTSVDVSDPSTYGALPDEGLVDTLKSGTLIDLVGYGDQNLIKGGGPCGGPCKPREGDAFTRFFGQTTLVATERQDQRRVHQAAFQSVRNVLRRLRRAGNTYSYRADTEQALTWVTSTVDGAGGSLSP